METWVSRCLGRLLKLKRSCAPELFHLKKKKTDLNPTSLYKAFLRSALGLASGFCGPAAAASVSADVSTLWKCKHFISLIKSPSLTSWGCEEKEVERRKQRAHHSKCWQQPLLQVSSPFLPGWDVETGNVFFFSAEELLSPCETQTEYVRGLRFSHHFFFSVYPSPRASDTVNKCCIWWTIVTVLTF